MSNLIFHKLKLTNFKSFAGTHKFDLQRAPGLYYIRGINKNCPQLESNGAGKTTLFDALLWCLYGSTSTDARPSTSVQSWHTPDETTGVVVFISTGSKKYRIKRTRNPNTLTLYCNGINKEVDQATLNKLLMQERIFRQGIFKTQRDRWFMDLTAEQQSTLLSEALSLDIWVAASEKAQHAAHNIKDKLLKVEQMAKALSSTVSILANTLAAAKAELLEARQKQKTKLAELRRQLETCSKKIEKLTAEQAELTKCTAPNGDMALVLNALAKTEVMLNASVAELAWCNDQLAQSNPICKTCAQPIAKTHLKTMKVTAKAAVNKHSLALADLKRKQTALAKLEAKAAAERQTLHDTNMELARLEQEKRALKQQLAAVPAANNNTVVMLRRKHGKMQATLNKTQQTVSKLQHKLGKYEFWVKEFKRVRLSIIDQVLLEFQQTTLTHAEQFGLDGWQLALKTERQLAAGGMTAAFNAVLCAPGQNQMKWQQCSGGELQRWQLAMMLGLTDTVLARAGIVTNIEIYDEPTKGLSDAGIDMLLTHLRQRALAQGKAIYIIDQTMFDRGTFDACMIVQHEQNGSRILQP